MIEAVEIINESGKAPMVLVCEHASNHIPDDMNSLGLSADILEKHIAWDLHALSVARLLSEALDAPLVAGKISRLVYDVNRPPEAEDACPAWSEAFEIPGNQALNKAQKQWRVETVYKPFQEALTRTLQAQMDRSKSPLLVTIHSFTPVYEGRARAVEIGILHDADARLADFMLEEGGDFGGFDVRRNQPYSPTDGVTHTLTTHGLKNNLHNVMIEIRNDLIASEDGRVKVSNALVEILIKAQAHNQEKRNAEVSP